MNPSHPAGQMSRRSLLGGSLAATAAAVVPRGVFAGGDDRIRLGLVGCGGRGVGAAIQAATSARGVEVAAIGDLFADQASLAADALGTLGGHAGRPLQRFVGPQAAEQVIAADVDLVILATPPHLRPRHAALAVQAGRHVFCEPPVATDAAGVRELLPVAAEARARGLSIACGFQSRHHQPLVDEIGRIRDGGIGRVSGATVVAELGLPWRRPRLPGWSDQEHDTRNWIGVPRFSGGPFVEHQVHAIDRALWAFGDENPEWAVPVVVEPALPEAAEPVSGVHVAYRFRDGRTLVAGIERRRGIETRVEERVFGTCGESDLRRAMVTEASGPGPHASCIATVVEAIRDGQRFDDLDSGCRSTMVAILGRDAVAAGNPLTWDALWRTASGIQPIQPLQSAGV